MRRAIGLLVLLSACADADEPRDDIDRMIDDTVARVHVPGAALAIVHDGEVVRRELRGVANLEWSPPVTSDTAFQIASTTKIFTGTLVLMLAEDGTIRLDDPVSRWLPDAPETWRGITIAHLAAHASGIAEVDAPDTASLEEVYARARATPLASPPGTVAAYGKTDLAVLELVLERASGERFGDLLRRRIFAPLGFTCTRYEDAAEDGSTRTAEVVPRRASLYRWTGDRQRTAWYLYPQHAYASGGAFSCLADLERWAIGLDEGRLFSAESERQAATAFRLAGGRDGGFSVVFAQTPLHGHRGYGHSGGPALGDIVRIPDEKLTVIVLTNQQKMYPDLAASIASGVLGAPPAPATAVDPDPARTAADRALIAASSTGEVGDALFTAEAEREVVPILREWGPIQAAPWPPLSDLVYVGARDHVREYVARYGPSIRARWTVTRDATGAIANLDMKLE